MSADILHAKRCLLPQIDMHLIKADVVPVRTEWSNHIVEHVFTNDHISLLRKASKVEQILESSAIAHCQLRLVDESIRQIQ